MYTSGDTLLTSLFLILLPAFLALIGIIVYIYLVSKRYNSALTRLYRSSFRGVDTERKRIASELHDTLAVSSITLSEDFIELKSKLKGAELATLQNIESNLNLFQFKTHQTIEYMYPKSLADLDWFSSLKLLTEQLSIGKTTVTFECFATNTPSNQHLYHTYWVVQEIITNAIRHANVDHLQVSIMDENNEFIISIHYQATTEAINWFNSKTKSKSGLGTLIIQDRLQIIGAKMKFEIIDKVITQSIIINNENISS
jgi:signal transduction histidine kinase